MLAGLTDRKLQSIHGIDKSVVEKVLVLICQMNEGQKIRTSIGDVVRVDDDSFQIQIKKTNLNDLANQISNSGKWDPSTLQSI